MPLSQGVIDAVVSKAAASDLAKNRWRDRGIAPIGYVKGMAVCYAQAYRKLLDRDPAALAMVAIVEGKRDIFDHYEDLFNAAGMSTDAPAADRLRYLFVALTGLGMRESSGRYCEGRDRSASNTTADTAEAGLFQQSWDSRSANPEISRLFGAYKANASGFLNIFKEGVTPKPGDLDNYGTGEGRDFQALIKSCPAFAVEAAAIGLRTLYTHWGPIIRREAELAPSAEYLFRQVQMIVDGAPKPAGKSWWQALLDLFEKPAQPAKPSAPAVPPWVTWAQNEVGFHEKGANLGIEKYIALAKTGSLGDPWCAIFANAGLEANGIRGTRSAMARSFERDPNFVKLSGPALGAITTMWRGSPSTGRGHVFYYLGENANGVLALGGNQSDQVCRQYEPRNRVVGYYWPKSVPLPKIGAIIVKDESASEGSET